MEWKIIKEHKRKFADTSYYLKAEKNITNGTLILEIKWVKNFMYDLSVDLYTKNTGLKSIFKKVSKRYIYGHLVSYNDRIEKYGHQIMRITNDLPLIKFNRLVELQGDSVLNWNLFDTYNLEIKTVLPEKI